MREDILRHYGGSGATGIREENVKVIYNGVDLEEFSPARSSEERSHLRERLGLTPDDVVVLFVGTGIFRKGFKHLLRAGAILKNRGIKICILAMGRPGGRGGANRLAKQWKMQGNVRFTPTHEHPANVYRAADLFCLPSLYEPFGFACLEALASGLPCIVSRACGAAEILSEAKNGYILEQADDADTLAKYIESLFDEKIRRQFAEGELSIIKGIGNNSPEIKNLKSEVAALKQQLHTDAVQYQKELEVEKKNNTLNIEALELEVRYKDKEIGRLMNKLQK